MRKIKMPAEPVIDEVRRIRAKLWRGLDDAGFNKWFESRFPDGSYTKSSLRPKKPLLRKRSK
jgi:hypothetical protein